MTIIQFSPSLTANVQFQATFDGAAYNVVVTWSLYSKRYYVTVFTLQNRRVYTIPLIGSPPDADISLNGGYFDTPFIYRVASRQFEIG